MPPPARWTVAAWTSVRPISISGLAGFHISASSARPPPLSFDGSRPRGGDASTGAGAWLVPVVPAKSNRINAWENDCAMYRRRNEIEHLFRRLKGLRRIFSRFEKFDTMLIAFIHFALIVEAFRNVNTPNMLGTLIAKRLPRKALIKSGFRHLREG